MAKRFVAFCSVCVAFLASLPNVKAFDGEGLSSQLLYSSPGPSNFAFIQSSSVLPHKGVSFGSVLQHFQKPIGLEIGDKLYWSVKRVNTVDFSWAVGIVDFFQIGLVLPISLEQAGIGAKPLDANNNKEELSNSAVGDIRLHGKIDLFAKHSTEKYRGPGVALEIAFSVPTGDEKNFFGEKGIVWISNFIMDFRQQIFSVAANLGSRLRSGPKAALADSDVGNQLSFGFGLTLHLLEEKLLLGGETTLLAEIDDFNRMGLELRGGVGSRPKNWPITLWCTASSGISNKDEPLLAIPRMRFTLGFTYVPKMESEEEEIELFY